MSEICFYNSYKYLRKSNTEPSNFCPITLQPVLAKICSSFISNWIYNFLIKNELLTHITNQAKNKRHQVIVTLDLQNVLDEVDNWLVVKVLEYQNLPAEIKTLMTNYYDSYATSVGTDNYSTKPMIVGKGVLQGDCLSPLP